MQALTSGDCNLVHGAMRVLTGIDAPRSPLTPELFLNNSNQTSNPFLAEVLEVRCLNPLSPNSDLSQNLIQ